MPARVSRPAPAGHRPGLLAVAAGARVAGRIRLPRQWEAPLPQGGRLAQLKAWWQGVDDPLPGERVGQAQAGLWQERHERIAAWLMRCQAVGSGWQHQDAATGPSLTSSAR